MREGKRASPTGIVVAVRNAIAANDFPGAESLLRNYRDDNGITPEALEAQSWISHGFFAGHRFARAADAVSRARPRHSTITADMKGREELVTRGRAVFAAIAQHLLCEVAAFAKRAWLVCDRFGPRVHLAGLECLLRH